MGGGGGGSTLPRLKESKCEDLSEKWVTYARTDNLDGAGDTPEPDEVKAVMKKDADWIWQQDAFCKTAKSMLSEEDRRMLSYCLGCVLGACSQPSSRAWTNP